MKGSVWKRCTTCRRKVNGRDAGARHKRSGCAGKQATWAYAVDLGQGLDGKRRKQVRGGFDTQEEAEQQLRATLGQLGSATYVDESDVTLDDYLAGRWLPSMRGRIAANTLAEWERRARSYVLPRLGHVALQKLTTQQLDELYSELLVSGRVDGAGGLSPSTVRDTHQVVRQALDDAVRWQLVRHNVALVAKPPRPAQAAARRREAMHVWSPEQLRAFLDATADTPRGPLWWTIAHTGLRRGEVLALRWADVDLDAGTLQVDQVIVLEHGRWVIRARPKSDAGARTIHLDEATVDKLAAWRQQLELERMWAEGAWEASYGLVFPTLSAVVRNGHVRRLPGFPQDPPAVGRAFRRECDQLAGVPRIRLHDLRHTHATLLLRAGVPVKVVSERLGHASPGFTLATYAHVIPGMGADAAQVFARTIAGDETGAPS